MARSGPRYRDVQWQEQPEPQPPELEPELLLDAEFASDFDSDFDSVFESALASPALALASPALILASPLLFAASGLLPEPLKSVAYQPLPLSWKPAAVRSLLKRGLPQSGQSVSGESDSFCSASSLCPQAPQRYS